MRLVEVDLRSRRHHLGQLATIRQRLFADRLNDETRPVAGRALAAKGFRGIAATVGLTGRDVIIRYSQVPRVPEWRLRNLMKYEVDKASGYLRVDRPQRTTSSPPALYGFIPRTYCAEEVAKRCPHAEEADGDPLDICVFSERHVTRADVVLNARVVGGIQMIDGGEADDKIVAVLENDNVWNDVQDIRDLPGAIVERLLIPDMALAVAETFAVEENKRVLVLLTDMTIGTEDIWIFDLERNLRSRFTFDPALDVFVQRLVQREKIESVLDAEEAQFNRTLDRGLKLFDDAAAKLKEKEAFPAETVVKLWETYGFPTDLTGLLRNLTSTPAGILRLPCGTLSGGSDADICIFDPEMTWQLDEKNMLSNGQNTPFLNWEMKGRVTHTLLAGRIVYTLEEAT